MCFTNIVFFSLYIPKPKWWFKSIMTHICLTWIVGEHYFKVGKILITHIKMLMHINTLIVIGWFGYVHWEFNCGTSFLFNSPDGVTSRMSAYEWVSLTHVDVWVNMISIPLDTHLLSSLWPTLATPDVCSMTTEPTSRLHSLRQVCTDVFR